MSTYKKHSCRKIDTRDESSNWEDHIVVLVFFILLVSLSLILN